MFDFRQLLDFNNWSAEDRNSHYVETAGDGGGWRECPEGQHDEWYKYFSCCVDLNCGLNPVTGELLRGR